MKLWAGRFQKDTDKRVNDFNSSLSFDCRMYKQDIRGSIAHADMLGRQGIIEASDTAKIIRGLKEILSDLENGRLTFENSDAEDIHMFIEEELTLRIGDAGKRLHTGRSRNDQVALDIRLYLRDELNEVRQLVIRLIEVIVNIAENNMNTVMPGYTHLQRAQPVTLAHYILAYAQMLIRDIGRLDDCLKRMNYSPLGSGALAGTTYPLDREYVAKTLEFSGVTQNSMDGVSDRDFVIEFASALSLIMTHLSRFSEEIILWCSSEFGFCELDDAYSTGSSIMPQKKNPDIAELVRGKTGRVNGNLVALLTVMKGLPLAYNKDMQEDKEAIFDSIDNTKLCLELFADMLRTCRFKNENMRKASLKGFINATDCADYLVRKGMPFRDAYKITGRLVAYCLENDKSFEEMSVDELKGFSDLFENDIFPSIDLINCVNGRAVCGGPSVEAVKKQLDEIKIFLCQAK
ncbi:MAG: argininosuccinate lyase [Firmicutes bacterium]|nr:argininosuccinate lyase [Bacillota bacterium]